MTPWATPGGEDFSGWGLLPKDKRPSAPSKVVEPMMGGFLLQLLAWAGPKEREGAIKAAHGLTPSKA